MLARSVGGFRPFARAGAIASIALIGMLLSANAAFAATAIGSAAGTVTSSSFGFDTVQMSSSTPGAYAVPPGGGKITSWSTLAGPRTGPVGLQVWRPTTTAGIYLLVGASPLVTLTSGTLNTITLGSAIAVQEGDLLGLRIEGIATYGLYTSSASDTYGSMQAPNPNPSGGAIDKFSSNTFFQLDVAATVDAAVVTPPPPPTGCDSTGTSNGGSNDNSATSPADTSATSPADTSSAVTADASTGAPADTSNVDSSDKSTKDSSDQSKKDMSAKDQSTGGDNCQQ